MDIDGLSLEVFQTQMKDLEELFNYTATKRQMELYYKYLQPKFTDEKFVETCQTIAIRERFFPSVSAFMEHKPKFMNGAF